MNAAYAIYILACLGLAYFVYQRESLDFRGAGRLNRRPKEALDQGEEADFAAPETTTAAARALAREKRRLARLVIEPRADFTVILAVGGIGALLTGAALGFLLPLALEAIGGGAAQAAVSPSSAPPRTDLAALSYAADAPMGRLAQVVGAAAGAAIALRMLRVFIGFAALAALIVAALAAVNFVIGRPALALFGA